MALMTSLLSMAPMPPMNRRAVCIDHQWIGNVSIGPIEVIDAIGIMEDVWKTSSLNGAIGANDATGTIVAIGTIFVIGIIIAIGTIV